MARPHCFRKYDAIIRMRYYMSRERERTHTELSDALKMPLTSFWPMMPPSYRVYNAVITASYKFASRKVHIKGKLQYTITRNR